MAEIDPIFDSNLKKKKKKKIGFNMEAALAEPEGDSSSNQNADSNEKDVASTDADAPLDAEFFGKKKSSKKKKQPFNVDEPNEALDGPPAEDVEAPAAAAGAPDINMDLGFDFSIKKKKKQKKKPKDIEELIADEDKENKELVENEKEDAWGDSERDYSYDELLNRAFDQLREKNPEMAAGEKKKFVMKPPQVLRIGSKKSAFANFNEICKLLHRMPKHVLQFLLAELGTSGSIDGNCQLIIKGRFQQKQIENVLRRYIKEYVTCHTCRSSDTILQKDARLYFLQCEQCNSRCSVAPIKSGFQAVANKQQRQAIRASKN